MTKQYNYFLTLCEEGNAAKCCCRKSRTDFKREYVEKQANIIRQGERIKIRRKHEKAMNKKTLFLARIIKV